MIIKVILIAIVLVGLAVAGIAIKMFFLKGSEFKKSCGSVDPVTGVKIGCSCGSDGESAGTCQNKTA
jgi:flagellar basal body-associated protein FliL